MKEDESTNQTGHFYLAIVILINMFRLGAKKKLDIGGLAYHT